jgi:hypothetical protein
VYDTFPTPFSDEVIDQVVGKEDYSFIYCFSRYIKYELKKKTIIRPPLLENKDPLVIISCLLGSRMHQVSFLKL